MNLDNALGLLAKDPTTPVDLAEVALVLARDEFPHLGVDAYLGELASMAHEARAYLRGTTEARLHGLCRYLFHDMGFRGNVRDYYDPSNSYLNQVLEFRTGLPITLTAVAIAVGNRAGLPVAGVGLPGHFVAKVVDEGRDLVFDPFHGGRRLTPEECEGLVERVTGVPFVATPEALQSISPGAFILRLLTNLKGSYLRSGDFARAARIIGRISQLVPGDPLQQRDLGVSLLQAGQPGRAVAPLNAYLEAVPNAVDAETVAQFLRQARNEVARWN